MTNKIFLIGNLTRDSELYETTNNSFVKFDIAVTRRFNNEKTDFFSCTLWGKSAEKLADSLSKGTKVSVVGSMEQDVSEKDGVKRYFYNVNVSELEFLSSKKVEDKEEPKTEEKTTKVVKKKK